MATFVSYTPKSAEAIVLQVEPEIRVTALFKESNKIVSVQASNKLERFFSRHCSDCHQHEEGDCEGGVSILEKGECDYNNIEDFIDTGDIEFKSPKHFMTIRMDASGSFCTDNITMFAYTSYGMGTGKLNATPYLAANVYGDGKICWGRNFPANNRSLRTAYNTFWNSTFNNDLVPRDGRNDQRIQDWLRKISYKALAVGIPAEDYGPLVKGKQNIISTSPSEIEGFFYSDNPLVVQRFNKSLATEDYRGVKRNLVVGWLKRESLTSKGRRIDVYHIDVFGQKFDYDTESGILGDLLV